MDFMTLAKERYSVRSFSEKTIEKEKLGLVLEAGRLAPTAVNFQPQRVLVIQSREAMEKLKECTQYHFNAPAALLVCYDKTVSWHRKHDNRDSGEIDAAISATHMMLQAAEIGLGTTWVMYFDPTKIKDVYNIPDNLEPVVLFPIGYPSQDAAPSKAHEQRLALDSTVFYDSFAGKR